MPGLPVKMIATDIDGTLLNRQGVISERNLRAIHAARDKGITVAIATGRFPENAFVLLENYGLRLPIIGVNGARIVDESLHLYSERTMGRDAAARTLETLFDLGSDFFMFGRQEICTSAEEMVHHSELSQKERMRELHFRYCHGPDAARDMVKRTVYKFFVCNNVDLTKVRQALSAVPGIGLTQSSARNIEVMPKGVDKGRGIADLARVLNIPLNQVMALGDESNDIPMLRAAGCGVAMGNGSEAAKAAARFVTDTNENDGFAKAIEAYALI